jgi:hypothetical protein
MAQTLDGEPARVAYGRYLSAGEPRELSCRGSLGGVPTVGGGAGEPGLEPGLEESKSPGLPLPHSPTQADRETDDRTGPLEAVGRGPVRRDTSNPFSCKNACGAVGWGFCDEGDARSVRRDVGGGGWVARRQ